VDQAWDRLRRHFHARSRLFVSLAIGLAVALLVPGILSPTLRAVIGWDCGTVVFLGLIITMAARATEASMRQRATLEDEARWVFLALVGGAAFFSMFAILSLMHEAKAAGGTVMLIQAILAGFTIVLSWLFTHTVFAVHYAHDYFKDLAENLPPGLNFPSERDDPD
jgi:uncharacterized membrane protein